MSASNVANGQGPQGPRILWIEFAGALVSVLVVRLIYGGIVMWAQQRAGWARAIVGVAFLETLLQAIVVFAIHAYRRRRFERAPKAPEPDCDICHGPNPRVVHLVLCDDHATSLAEDIRRASSTAARPQLPN